MASYSGPSDNIVLADKAYRIGDDVPLSKEQQAALEAAGHIFADTDLEAVARANNSMPLAPADTAPRDERGAPMTLSAASSTTTPRSSSSSSTSSTSSAS